MKFGCYWIGTAQLHDGIKEKIKFRFWPNSTVSLLVGRSDMPGMRFFSTGGMKNEHDAILESFGTTEKIKISFSRLPSYRQQLTLFFLLSYS